MSQCRLSGAFWSTVRTEFPGQRTDNPAQHKRSYQDGKDAFGVGLCDEDYDRECGEKADGSAFYPIRYWGAYIRNQDSENKPMDECR